jgi:hypothetical protein
MGLHFAELLDYPLGVFEPGCTAFDERQKSRRQTRSRLLFGFCLASFLKMSRHGVIQIDNSLSNQCTHPAFGPKNYDFHAVPPNS